MSLILKNTVKTIDDKSKSYFVDKLKQYDYLIDEKEKKLSELEEELEKRKNGLEENKTREGKVTYDFDNSIIDLLTETSYLDKNISYTLCSSLVRNLFKYSSLSSGNIISILYISCGVNLFLRLRQRSYLLSLLILAKKSLIKSS